MIIVDRIENGFAVCEIGDCFVDIPLSSIRGAVKEGCVLVEDEQGYYVNDDETERRKKELFEKQKKLFFK